MRQDSPKIGLSAQRENKRGPRQLVLGGATKDCAGRLLAHRRRPIDPGCGVIFKLTPDGTETALHSFSGGSDGSIPNAQLLMVTPRYLYGAAASGGRGNFGNVFKVKK